MLHPDITEVKIEKLLLDKKNPRFAKNYNKEKGTDAELIEYLYKEEGASQLVTEILEEGFFKDEAIWLIKKNEKYLVKDGNRRVAAVKILNEPDKSGLNEKTIKGIKSKIKSFEYNKIDKLPAIIYTDSNSSLLEKRISKKHTNDSFKAWSPIAQALRVQELLDTGAEDENNLKKIIGRSYSNLRKMASFYNFFVDLPEYKIQEYGIEKSDFLNLFRSPNSRYEHYQRTFSQSDFFGFIFDDKFNFRITNEEKFKKYFKKFLIVFPKITAQQMRKDTVVNLIDEKYNEIVGGSGTNSKLSDTSKEPSSKKSSNKNVAKKDRKPIIDLKAECIREKIPETIKIFIDEFNKIPPKLANVKVAMSRVTYEYLLKYVLMEVPFYESTKNPLSKGEYFKDAFYYKGKPKKYTDFEKLEKKFFALLNKTDLETFKHFDKEAGHQAIHNYKTIPSEDTAIRITASLVSVAEFLMDKNIFSKIDTAKVKEVDN